jgi:predicted nucleic acid-binding protein
MKFVLDSNVIFSCLISGKKFYIDLLSQNQCFAPDFIFEEIKKYEDRILSKSSSNINFKEFTREIFSNLVILPKLAIENENWKKAHELCKDIDEKDTAFVALSLELDLPLLTRDKKLHEKLKNKQFENIMLLDKFLEYIDEK